MYFNIKKILLCINKLKETFGAWLYDTQKRYFFKPFFSCKQNFWGIKTYLVVP